MTLLEVRLDKSIEQLMVTEEVFLLLPSALHWHSHWSELLVKLFDSVSGKKLAPQEKYLFIFLLLHPATSAYILKYKGRARFEKKSINMEVTVLVSKRWLYLLDCSTVPYDNLRKEKGSGALYGE